MRLGHGQRRAVAILWLWTALLSAFVLYPVYTGEGDSIVPIALIGLVVLLLTFFFPNGLRVRREDKEAAEAAQEAKESLRPLRSIGGVAVGRVPSSDDNDSTTGVDTHTRNISEATATVSEQPTGGLQENHELDNAFDPAPTHSEARGDDSSVPFASARSVLSEDSPEAGSQAKAEPVAKPDRTGALKKRRSKRR